MICANQLSSRSIREKAHSRTMKTILALVYLAMLGCCKILNARLVSMSAKTNSDVPSGFRKGMHRSGFSVHRVVEKHLSKMMCTV